MPPHEDFESARVHGEHPGRRVQPEPAAAAPATAWCEAEEPADRSPGEHRRLLPADRAPPLRDKARLHSGLTLGVLTNYPQKCTGNNNYQKTRFEKRKQKLIEVLRPPYFILSMIVVMVCIHWWGSERLRAQLEWFPGAWRRQPWRSFSYGLVHATTAHLALNALVALAVGWFVEREQGWWRAAAVWCAGVWCGALGAGALQPSVRVVGASAAVYALLTAHLPNVCLRFGHVPLWWFRPLGVVVLGTSEACWALVRAAPAPGAGAGADGQLPYEHVAWAAHALGAAVGVPLGFLVFTGENSKTKHVIAARVVSALLLVAGLALAVFHYYFGEGAGT